jgi:hypothetical protein
MYANSEVEITWKREYNGGRRVDKITSFNWSLKKYVVRNGFSWLRI